MTNIQAGRGQAGLPSSGKRRDESVEKEMPKDMERNQEVQDGSEVKNRGAKCSLI